MTARSDEFNRDLTKGQKRGQIPLNGASVRGDRRRLAFREAPVTHFENRQLIFFQMLRKKSEIYLKKEAAAAA